jgi:hypothetical protein
MRYLLVKEKSGKFVLYCPEIFGSETWGLSTQVSLEKKKKYWYIHLWTAGNEWVEDTNEKHRINVVLETSDLEEVIGYVSNATNGDQGAIGSILVQAQDIYHDYVAFENWANSKRK